MEDIFRPTMRQRWRDFKWAIKWRYKRFRRQMIPDDMRVKLLLRAYLDENDFERYSLGIHSIKVRSRLHWVKVTITLARPGLLIGRQGKTIGHIQKCLSRNLSKEVRISIKEFDPFSY